MSRRRGGARRFVGWVAWLALSAAACEQGQPAAPVNVVGESQLGGQGFQTPTAVTSTGDGTVVGGYYVEGFSIGDLPVAAGAGIDGVVVSLDDAGVPRWVQPLTGSGDDYVVALDADAEGNVFVAGEITAGASFGAREIAVEGDSAALLAKLDGAGNLLWAVAGRGLGYQSANAVAADGHGGVYVGGDFTGDLDVGAGPVTATDDSDAFLARFTTTGELLWVKILGGAGGQHVAQLAVGPGGDVALIGDYRGELALTAPPLPGNPAANRTPFVARFGADGALAWVQTDLIPPELNHMGHLTYEEVHHPGAVVQDLTVSFAPTGAVVAALAYGGSFAHSEHDFEAPRVSNLMVTSMDAGGEVTAQDNLPSPNAAVQLARIFADGDHTQLVASWTGQMSVMGGASLNSEDHRSLLLLDLNPSGHFVVQGKLTVDGYGLTGQDAARRADGSLLVAAGRTDLVSDDRDILVARFR